MTSASCPAPGVGSASHARLHDAEAPADVVETPVRTHELAFLEHRSVDGVTRGLEVVAWREREPCRRVGGERTKCLDRKSVV